MIVDMPALVVDSLECKQYLLKKIRTLYAQEALSNSIHTSLLKPQQSSHDVYLEKLKNFEALLERL